ncbi:Ig-like domain-containing protein [Exiguobacterium profundum]
MKRLVGVFTVLLLLFNITPASAEVRMSTVSQIAESNPFDVIVREDTLYSLNYRGIDIYDIETGTLLNSIVGYVDENSMAVSSDQAWIVLNDYNGVGVYNQFGDLDIQLRDLEFNGKTVRLDEYCKVKFLPNSTVLVIASNDQLVFYDVETKQVTFMRGIDTSGDLQVSEEYITIGYTDSIQVLNHQGQAVTEIMASTPIQSYSMNQRGQLIYNSTNSDLHYFETPLSEEQSVMKNVSGEVRLDGTGTFVGTDNAVLYDLYTKKRIYTNAKEGAFRFNEDSSRLFSIGQSITVYNAQNLKKRIQTIAIEVDETELIEGNELSPAILVKSKDGSQTKVTDKVVWRSNNSQVAYFSQNKLILKSPGKFTLKATYEDHETSVELTVKKDPRPSDNEWLKQQKQSLEKRRAFLNSPHRLYSEFSKVRGVAGQFFFDDEKLISGKYQENWLYETYKGKKKVDGMMLLLDYEKREITEAEIKKVFGKPKDTYNFSYYDSIPTKLIRGKSAIDESLISDAALYLINKKHGLIIFYDLEGNVIYMHLGESTKLW